MRIVRAGLAVLLLTAPCLRAAEPKDCLAVSARIDNDTHSPSGIRVIVIGRNRCSEDVDTGRVSFLVTAHGSGTSVVGSQHGNFGGTAAPNASVETLVFVVCDPDRVRSVSVKTD
jgi:hypothetical protein